MLIKLKEAVQVVKEKVSEVLPMSFDDAVGVYAACLKGEQPERRTLCRAIQALLRDVGVCDELVFMLSRLHHQCAEDIIRNHVSKIRQQDPRSPLAEAFDVVMRGVNR